MIEMNKKLYYAIIIPLFIIGFIFPASQSYLMFVLILVSSLFLLIESKEKLKKAEGEEEIRNVIVPLILLMLPVVLFIISFI